MESSDARGWLGHLVGLLGWVTGSGGSGFASVPGMNSDTEKVEFEAVCGVKVK